VAYGQNTAQPDDSGPLAGARPDPCLEDPRRHAPAHPDGSPCPCDGLSDDELLYSVLPYDLCAEEGRLGGGRDVEHGDLLQGQGARLLQRRPRHVGHDSRLSNKRRKSGRLWCLGGDPGVRSGAISRLGGDQRRQRLRSDLSSGGWMVTRCDAGAVAGPAGLKTQRAGRRRLGLRKAPRAHSAPSSALRPSPGGSGGHRARSERAIYCRPVLRHLGENRTGFHGEVGVSVVTGIRPRAGLDVCCVVI